MDRTVPSQLVVLIRPPPLLFAAALCLMTLSACAWLGPPVEVLPDPPGVPTGTPPEDADAGDAPLRLRVREARPNGLLLELSANSEQLQEWTWLEIWRARGEQDATPLQQIALDPTRIEALAGGVPLLDRDLRPDQPTAYQLRLRGREEDPEAAGPMSPVLRTRWETPPPAPSKIEGRALGARAVELSWAPRQGWGVLVFRRDLGPSRAPPRRVAELGPEAGSGWLDRQVEPGGLYAYRLAHARRAPGGWPIYGVPSVELYVTVPRQ